MILIEDEETNLSEREGLKMEKREKEEIAISEDSVELIELIEDEDSDTKESRSSDEVKNAMDSILSRIDTSETSVKIEAIENPEPNRRLIQRPKRLSQQMLDESNRMGSALATKRPLVNARNAFANENYVYFQQSAQNSLRVSTRNTSRLSSSDTPFSSPAKTPPSSLASNSPKSSPSGKRTKLSVETSEDTTADGEETIEEPLPESSLVTVNVVNNKRIHTCDKCGLEFTSSNSVHRHQERSCLRIKIISIKSPSKSRGESNIKKCPICSCIFYSTHRVSIHIYKNHRNLLGSASNPPSQEAHRLYQIEMQKGAASHDLMSSESKESEHIYLNSDNEMDVDNLSNSALTNDSDTLSQPKFNNTF